MIFRRNRAKGGKFIALTFLYFFFFEINLECITFAGVTFLMAFL